MNSLNDHHDAQELIRGNAPRRTTVARTIAENVSKRGIAARKAELCNEVLSRLIELCYEPDTDNAPANVDAKTGRIEIPMPWSKTKRRGERHGNYKRVWGLRRGEADIIRAIVMRIHLVQGTHCLFLFDEQDRKWYLNAPEYRTKEDAFVWLDRAAIDAALWRKATATWVRGIYE